MNILITGHRGFVGNSLLGKLKSPENLIVGISRSENKKYPTKYQADVELKGDIRDTHFLRRVITDYEIEEIYHFAAQSIIRTCANDPQSTFDIGVMGTVSLLEACRTPCSTVKSITVSTSDKAFGHSEILPYNEKTPLNPLFTYETAKACQQLITICYAKNYNVPTRVVACSNIYGPGDYNMTRIIPNTITRLAKGQKAQLNSGVANFVREFVYIDDVTDAFIKVSRNGSSGEVYCCGGTGHDTISNIIKNICNNMGKDFDKDVEQFQRASQFKEIEKQYMNSTKLKSIGWNPKVSLNEGLKRTVEFYTELVEKTK